MWLATDFETTAGGDSVHSLCATRQRENHETPKACMRDSVDAETLGTKISMQSTGQRRGTECSTKYCVRRFNVLHFELQFRPKPEVDCLSPRLLRTLLPYPCCTSIKIARIPASAELLVLAIHSGGCAHFRLTAATCKGKTPTGPTMLRINCMTSAQEEMYEFLPTTPLRESFKQFCFASTRKCATAAESHQQGRTIVQSLGDPLDSLKGWLMVAFSSASILGRTSWQTPHSVLWVAMRICAKGLSSASPRSPWQDTVQKIQPPV